MDLRLKFVTLDEFIVAIGKNILTLCYAKKRLHPLVLTAIFN